LWIGLTAAALAIVACVCALAVIAVLAGLRGGWFGAPAGTQSPGSLGTTPALPNPGQPGGEVTPLPPVKDSWPLSDVPMPAEADLGTLIGVPAAFSVITDQDFDEVLAFYQSEMDALGWSKVSYGTRITQGDADLQYRKDDVHVTITLARIPYVGTLVEIRTRAA
jgi:hypothetical protein